MNNVQLGSNVHASAPSLNQQLLVTVAAGNVALVVKLPYVESQTYQNTVWVAPQLPDLNVVVYQQGTVELQPVFPTV